MSLFLVIVLLCVALNASFMLKSISSTSRVVSLKALEQDVISKLDEIKSRHDRLAPLDSPEANKERESIEDIVNKYTSYKEIKLMIVKMSNMIKNEASEGRKNRQLSNFIQLYKGELELEEVLKEKLGLPYSKVLNEIPLITELNKITNEVALLQNQVDKITVVVSPGGSTRETRFLKN